MNPSLIVWTIALIINAAVAGFARPFVCPVLPTQTETHVRPAATSLRFYKELINGIKTLENTPAVPEVTATLKLINGFWETRIGTTRVSYVVAVNTTVEVTFKVADGELQDGLVMVFRPRLCSYPTPDQSTIPSDDPGCQGGLPIDRLTFRRATATLTPEGLGGQFAGHLDISHLPARLFLATPFVTSTKTFYKGTSPSAPEPAKRRSMIDEFSFKKSDNLSFVSAKAWHFGVHQFCEGRGELKRCVVVCLLRDRGEILRVNRR